VTRPTWLFFARAIDLEIIPARRLTCCWSALIFLRSKSLASFVSLAFI
jgi:hypothetical protein